jgi:hypothetical protein
VSGKARHGHCVKGRWSREYSAWVHMRGRCDDSDNSNYGGRGITVCQRWRDSFEAFVADVGPAPSRKHTIDRIDNTGNYEPGNVRWATRKEQNLNRRPRRAPVSSVTLLDGSRVRVKDLARFMGQYEDIAVRRLSYGWSVGQAIVTPVVDRKDSRRNV